MPDTKLSTPARLAIGLATPFIAILGAFPILDKSHTLLFGMPLLMDWLFLWLALTSLCMALCWWLHDRHQPEDAP